MNLTFGQLAGLIAAFAFLLLVVFICVSLSKLTQTINEMNKSIKMLTDDADGIAHEVEDLVQKTNTLMADINQKSAKIDPVFDAAADLAKSVSDLNTAGQDLAGHLKDSVQKTTKMSLAYNTGRKAFKVYRAFKARKQTTDSERK